MKDYAAIANEYHAGYGQLAKEIPATTKAFGELVTNATQDAVLSKKTKELIVFAIAITVRWLYRKPCKGRLQCRRQPSGSCRDDRRCRADGRRAINRLWGGSTACL